jgi:RNA polymerase sigma-70 factor (ECF subfamily)
MSPPRFPPKYIERIIALRPALRRQATFLIGRRTQIGAPDDYVQDTMITALMSADRYAEDNLSGWLMSILNSHIRNARRRAHVRTSVPLSPVNTDDGDAVTIDLPVAAPQELRLDVADALAALATLRVVDQEIIYLARIDELSHDEIAARLGLPLGTLHARLSRATARLRAAYDAEPEVPAAMACARSRRAA